MKLRFKNDRLEMVPETLEEEQFVTSLVRLVNAVSNDLVGWHGDVYIDDSNSGYVITWKSDKSSPPVKEE